MKTIGILLIFSAAVWAQSIRVNAGGPAYTDKSGNVWAADKSAPNSYVTAAAITGTSDPALYQSEAWAPGKLEYQFAVTPGTYNVTLKFAEIYFSGAGQRVFNVVINGTQVEPKFDPFAASGAKNTAIDRTYPVTVTGGAIDIQLVSVVENPKISAIDIEPAPAPVPVTTTSAPPPPPPAPAISFADQETPAGAIDGANAAFSLAHTPSPAASLILVRNGVVLHAGADYTLNGAGITFKAYAAGDLTFSAGIPQVGDILLAWYRY